MMDIRLDPREYLAVNVGADIYDRGDAVDGRALEKHGLVEITEAQNPPRNGAARQPYFGIRISTAGREWLARGGIYQRGTGVY